MALAWLAEGDTGRQRAVVQNSVGDGSNAFYNEDKGVNYGQARYLCYYLQQNGLLVKFYQEFHTQQKADPTGYKSLQKVLSETDMDAFQEKWEKFVLGLTR